MFLDKKQELEIRATIASLYFLAKSVHQHIKLEKVVKQDKTLTIQGQAVSNESLQHYAASLDKQPFFAQVVLETVNHREADAVYAKDFVIKIQLDGDMQTEEAQG